MNLPLSTLPDDQYVLVKVGDLREMLAEDEPVPGGPRGRARPPRSPAGLLRRISGPRIRDLRRCRSGPVSRDDRVPTERCTCSRIQVGTETTEYRNWSRDCPVHGGDPEMRAKEDALLARYRKEVRDDG